jgi:hypothetical protein
MHDLDYFYYIMGNFLAQSLNLRFDMVILVIYKLPNYIGIVPFIYC